MKEAGHGADTSNPTAGEVEASRSLALSRQFRLLSEVRPMRDSALKI